MPLEGGKAALVERTQSGFHYSAIPTEQYRTRFGYLTSCEVTGLVPFRSSNRSVTASGDKTAAVPGDDGLMYCLPPEILEAGVARLTAVIHTLSAAYDFWDGRGRINPDQTEWPHESGGRATLEKIFDRCRKMREPTFKREHMLIDEHLSENDPDLAVYLEMADPVLYQLLEPERQRQSAEMVKAIDRVCEIIEDSRQRSMRLD